MTTRGDTNTTTSSPSKLLFRPARTILRIKRRRDEEPIPGIRLEGVVGSSNRPLHREEEIGGVKQDGTILRGTNRSSSNTNNNNNISKKNHTQSSAVLWKRFEPGDDDVARKAGVASSPSDRFRIVDAMLVDDSDDTVNQDEDDIGSSRRKRRKLTLLDTSTTTSAEVGCARAASNRQSPLHSMMASSVGAAAVTKSSSRTPLKILDPLTRIVDDSLQEVLAGSKPVAGHYDLLTTDPRFTLQPIQLQKKWLTWSHSSGGNLLHCCALWNDSAVSHQVLQQSRHRYEQVTTSLGGGATGVDGGHNNGTKNNNSSSILSMMEAVDGDGRTPYEVAQMVGHHDVCQVLEAYGGDTTNYVYDIFFLDDGTNYPTGSDDDTMMESKGDGHDDDDDDHFPSKIMTAELTSGVGYWTPEGELVLEADEKCSRSLSYETDGDIDSNCEEYGGNDYPDEEDEVDDGEDLMGGRDGVHDAILQSNGEGYDDDYDYDDGRLDQVYDNYDEYDWEQDLGNGKEHSYYDESHYDIEDNE